MGPAVAEGNKKNAAFAFPATSIVSDWPMVPPLRARVSWAEAERDRKTLARANRHVRCMGSSEDDS